MALLAALPFGAEFQQRTLPLVLSQPIERARIYAEKFWVPALAGGLVLLVDCRTWSWLEHFGFWDLVFVGLMVLATATLSGVGILLTRSRTAGIALGILGQLLVFGSLPFTVRLLYAHYPVEVATVMGQHKAELAAALGLYAFGFVWLGRRFWRTRARTLALTVAAIATALCLGRVLAGLGAGGGAHSGNASFEMVFVPVTACSAGFWALTARSTVGGLVFCVGSQVLAALVLVLVVTKGAALAGVQLSDDLGAVMFGVGGLIYAALFLWLGRRKFARLELRDAVFGEGIEFPGTGARGRWWSGGLVCRPDSHMRNLFRKELRLQQPVLLTGLVFLGCWVAALVLHELFPQQGYQRFLEFLPFFYAPVVLLLAGCVSLADEKTLGVAGWQLTLPVPPRRLWAVKLVVANFSGLALGFVLPALLLGLAASTDPLSQFSFSKHGIVWALTFLGAWLLILVSFWAATLVSNVIRAGLTTVAALAIGAGFVALGICAGYTLAAAGGLQTGLLKWIMTHRHMSPNALTLGSMHFMQAVVLAAAAGWFFLFLRQSLRHFRHPEVRWRSFLKQISPLALLLIVCPCWVTDFCASTSMSWPELQAEVDQALHRLPALPPVMEGKPSVVTLEELAATGALSDATRTWLTGATISCQSVNVVAPGTELDRTIQRRYGLPNGRTWFVFIDFPVGGRHSFTMIASWQPADGPPR